MKMSELSGDQKFEKMIQQLAKEGARPLMGYVPPPPPPHRSFNEWKESVQKLEDIMAALGKHRRQYTFELPNDVACLGCRCCAATVSGYYCKQCELGNRP